MSSGDADSTVKTESNPDEDVKPIEPVEDNTTLGKYWKAVKENVSDFTGWTYLLQYVEQENKLDDAREAYEAFFQHYAYCYGYWKKQADMEKRHGFTDKAIAVYETGVKTIPVCVELWLHYISFYVTYFVDSTEDIRKLYERAIKAAGTDFRSDKLWDSYISWEKDLPNVTSLHDRVLTIPTQLYRHHYDSFKHHVETHHPKEILSLDDFLKLRKEIVNKTILTGDDDESVMDEGPPAFIGPPGLEVPPGMEDTEGGKCDTDEAIKLKDRLITTREVMYRKNEEEVSKRWNFEEAIKRPYFHVKPLERGQLKNWREYLDWEIQNGTHERVVVLFERCMIACALYEDFWMKYAKYMEDHSLDAVRTVYSRACKIHLPKKPYIHMAWASFEERQGNYDGAYDVLATLEKSVPGLIMVAMRRISLERRRGNLATVETFFKDYIENAASPEIASFYSIKYARFLLKIKVDPEAAREVFKQAIEKDMGNLKLYLQTLDLEYQCTPVDEEKVNILFESLLNCENFSLETKAKMSQRKLEFLEDFCTDIKKLKDAYDEHQKLMKDLHTERKKRSYDAANYTQSMSEEPPEKKQKSEPPTNGASESMSQSAGTEHGSYPYWGSYNNSSYAAGYGQHWTTYGSHYYP
ncbi:pre-mRNA-processing factor 39-like isoform X1 [Mytilus galloprovincialis]|uniref:pre-mRNA-processing factor 39-like isoform X1 n=1 Tax=Mytilus galloprovincialis TaxID=29158 RepID=UPI003F7C28A8